MITCTTTGADIKMGGVILSWEQEERQQKTKTLYTASDWHVLKSTTLQLVKTPKFKLVVVNHNINPLIPRGD